MDKAESIFIVGLTIMTVFGLSVFLLTKNSLAILVSGLGVGFLEIWFFFEINFVDIGMSEK